MNTESIHDKVSTTTGGRLRQARENMGLSQQAVAKKLCLKVSTVRDIEDDHDNPNLASTFLRGYIRSYARLVNISEEELMPIMAKQAPIKTLKIAPMQSFSLSKTRKKCDSWLMGFTWLILFVVIGLTGAWWLQNHKAQQQNIANMVDQSSTKLSQGNDPMSRSRSDNISQSLKDQITNIDTSVPSALTTDAAHTPNLSKHTANGTSTLPVMINPSSLQSVAIPVKSEVPGIDTTDLYRNMLIINFTGDCWIEVLDKGQKKLFRGIQHRGTRLNLSGQAPYKLKIGNPAAVHIEYQGKPLDLSRFILTNQIARLTVPVNK